MFLRNVNSILEKETQLFEQAGIVKVGYHGPIRSLRGGEVWYTFHYKGRPSELYTGYFENSFGSISLMIYGMENPKLGNV